MANQGRIQVLQVQALTGTSLTSFVELNGARVVGFLPERAPDGASITFGTTVNEELNQTGLIQDYTGSSNYTVTKSEIEEVPVYYEVDENIFAGLRDFVISFVTNQLSDYTIYVFVRYY